MPGPRRRPLAPGTGIQIDDDGYLINLDDWDDKTACAVAVREGLATECPLTAERMAILEYMRESYKEFGAFPVLRAICKQVRQANGWAYEQFPNPIVAWRIAGLPKPVAQGFANVRH